MLRTTHKEEDLLQRQALLESIFETYQVSPPAVKLLRFCAFLEDKPIPLHLLLLHPEFTTTTLQHLHNWFEYDEHRIHVILTKEKRQTLRDYLTALKTQLPLIEDQVRSLILEIINCITYDLNQDIVCDPAIKELIKSGYIEHAKSLLNLAEKFPPEFSHFTALSEALGAYNGQPIQQEPAPQPPIDKQDEAAAVVPTTDEELAVIPQFRLRPAFARLPNSMFAPRFRSANRVAQASQTEPHQEAVPEVRQEEKQKKTKKTKPASSGLAVGTLFAGMVLGGGAVAAALLYKNSSPEATSGIITSLTEKLTIRK